MAYVRALLATITDLPAWTRQIVVSELMDRFGADKKHTDSHYCDIVPDSSGHLIRLLLEKTETNHKLIDAAFRKVCLGDASKA